MTLSFDFKSINQKENSANANSSRDVEIGIIGGSGLYSLGGFNFQQIKISTEIFLL